MAGTVGRLVWDKTGEKFFETGTDRGVVYPIDSSGAYPLGAAWNGLTGVTYTPSGAEATKLYANNGNYVSLYSAEEVGGTITAYTYPDEFAVCDGSAELTKGVRLGQQTRKAFGLSWRTYVGNDVDGQEHAYIVHVIYGAMASPSERGYKSVNDSPEAVELSWEFTTTPVNVTGFKPTAYLEIDSRTVTEAAMKAIEDVLYGKDESEKTDARLPLPDEIKSIIESAAAA